MDDDKLFGTDDGIYPPFPLKEASYWEHRCKKAEANLEAAEVSLAESEKDVARLLKYGHILKNALNELRLRYARQELTMHDVEKIASEVLEIHTDEFAGWAVLLGKEVACGTD